MKFQDLRVVPIDGVKLAAWAVLQMYKDVPPDNAVFHTDNVCVVASGQYDIISDCDCVFGVAEKGLYDGMRRPQNVATIAVRKKIKIPGGHQNPMFPTFYIHIKVPQLIKEFGLPAVSLPEFQGSRHNYNPRIETNQRGLLKFYNENIEK